MEIYFKQKKDPVYEKCKKISIFAAFVYDKLFDKPKGIEDFPPEGETTAQYHARLLESSIGNLSIMAARKIEYVILKNTWKLYSKFASTEFFQSTSIRPRWTPHDVVMFCAHTSHIENYYHPSSENKAYWHPNRRYHANMETYDPLLDFRTKGRMDISTPPWTAMEHVIDKILETEEVVLFSFIGINEDLTIYNHVRSCPYDEQLAKYGVYVFPKDYPVMYKEKQVVTDDHNDANYGKWSIKDRYIRGYALWLNPVDCNPGNDVKDYNETITAYYAGYVTPVLFGHGYDTRKHKIVNIGGQMGCHQHGSNPKKFIIITRIVIAKK